MLHFVFWKTVGIVLWEILMFLCYPIKKTKATIEYLFDNPPVLIVVSLVLMVVIRNM